MSDIFLGVKFKVETCCNCFIPFAMPEDFQQARMKDKQGFHCPNGHLQSYTGETYEARIAREKNEITNRLQATINEERHARLVAEKAVEEERKKHRLTQRRIAHGVCPCCNKTFANVAHHMTTDHKDYRLPAGKKVKELTA